MVCRLCYELLSSQDVFYMTDSCFGGLFTFIAIVLYVALIFLR
jgi:hypothetical protein